MYFSEHKFAVEIYENGHTDRNQNEENERQTKTEKIITTNFFTGLILWNIFFEISKIQNYFPESKKEKLEKEKKAEIKEIKGKVKKTRSSNKRTKKQK